MRLLACFTDSIKSRGRLAVFAVVPALLFFCQSAAPQSVPLTPSQTDAGKYLEHLVPFVPTPLEVAQKMLEVAKVQPDDVVYDLGSGDGRIVILAAQKFGAHAVGVELNSDLYEQSSQRIRKLGLQDRAQIIHENMFEVNVRHATVVTLYLLTAVNERLRPHARAATSFRSTHRLARFPGPRLAARADGGSHFQGWRSFQDLPLCSAVREDREIW